MVNPDKAWTERLVNELEDQYLEVKILPDGSVAALQDPILLGVNEQSFTTHFEDRSLADKHWDELQTEDNQLEGYTARRP